MSTLKVNSLQPANAGSEDYFLARSWMNANGTGTVAIRNDGGTSSITDNGTGDYTVSFTNTLSASSYAVSGGAGNTAASGGDSRIVSFSPDGVDKTTGSVRIETFTGATAADPALVCVMTFL